MAIRKPKAKTTRKTREQLLQELTVLQLDNDRIRATCDKLRTECRTHENRRAGALADIVARLDRRNTFLEGVLGRIEQEERRRFCSENRITETVGDISHTGPALQNFNGEVNFSAGLFGIPGEPSEVPHTEHGAYSNRKPWYRV